MSLASIVSPTGVSPTGGVAQAAPPPGLWHQERAAAADETPASGTEGTRTAQAEPAPADAPPPAGTAHLPEEQMRKMIHEEMDRAQKPFEYHGYLRSGFGFNGKLGDQEAFQAPNAGAKYRLGNETETYGEMIFVNNWLRPETAADSLFFKTEILLTFVTKNDSNFDATDVFTVREAFAQAGGVIPSMPDLKFWAGQRYYHRLDTHIHDFFYLSMSGYGGGFEDLALGNEAAGKLAGGYFGASTSADTDLDGVVDELTDNGRPVKHVLDLRLEDVHLGGLATFWLAGSHYAGGDRIVGGDELPDSNGFAAGFIHTIPEFLGGFNKLAVQYGTGPLLDYDVFYRTPAEKPQDPNPGLTVEDAFRFRALDALVLEMAPSLSFMGTVLFQLTDFGAENDSRQTWVSIGGRPIFHFGDHVNLAFEAGFDYTKSDFGGPDGGELAGWLSKLTVAPEIMAGPTFFGRPAIRAYFTYAFWADDFEGLIGGTPYLNDTAGIGAGLQIESWW
ncbi:MAG TPA: carbohydrate porin [Kofleriaceae bacterium]|nr:carbohydrate porin [Kofleriaceae bacterium]